ncbi:ATP-binding protein [Herbaspirillum lusitanum]|uniref:histidine kinase n=1 Tax=Herbaspirillum lusitanum TaxID=213312 RepID=A0ABW9A489_9BURK
MNKLNSVDMQAPETRKAPAASTSSPSTSALDAAALRFRLTDYSYAPLSETGAVAYLRAWRLDAQSPPLAIARARSDLLLTEAASQLRHELALRTVLDSAWAIKPMASVSTRETMTLLYEDGDVIALDKLAPHAIAPECFLPLAWKMADATEAMHGAGLTHRNLNPACFFIDADRTRHDGLNHRVRIGGFGFAALSDAGAPMAAGGAPPYLSPEHSGRSAHAVDLRSDLYSLGIMFYAMLAGHLPFGISGLQSTAAEWMHFHIASEAVPLDQFDKNIPAPLSQLVMRLLEKNPARRYQSAAALKAGLEQCSPALPPTAANVPPVAGICNSSQKDVEASTRISPDMRNGDARLASETAGIRDLSSVIRAARALTEKIQLDELVQSIMSVTLEHVGAERGLLIRVDGKQSWIEACARTTASGITVDLTHAAVSADDLPLSMLNLALISGHRICAREDGSLQQLQSDLPDDHSMPAADNNLQLFTALCFPLLKQGKVVGALYLENRVLPDAFTIEHTQILQLLASQAAISLENARLYAALLAENAQRARAESALRASQTSLKLGEQFNHTGSMRYLLQEGLMYCSEELCRIYGLESGKDYISYEEFSALMHPDDRASVLETVEAAIAAGGTIRVEHRICRKSDGEVRYISGIGKPFYVDGKCSEYVGTATDITSRRQAEDALRMAQADLARVARATTVGQLTASIAHEINQPLMSIVSNAGASLRWLDRQPMHLENARAGLHDIVSEGQRAGEMIRSLQSLTRNTEPVFERINLNAAIRHILAISRSELERCEVSLQLALVQENVSVQGDFVQIQQVLLNLVINAIEAMADITTRARVLSISSFIEDGTRITVKVEDTGEGMSEADTGRVFEAFYTTKKNGMGMGLAICRSIVESHKGRLHAEVRQPHGSVFSFYLPLSA